MNEQTIDTMRDLAIEIEGIDLELARRLMAAANKWRPNGPLIKKKLMAYDAKIKSGDDVQVSSEDLPVDERLFHEESSDERRDDKYSDSDYPVPLWAYASLAKRKYVLKKFIGPNSKGAELGVFRGVFSEFILKVAAPKLFYMVDGWELLFGDVFTWGGDYTCNGTLPTKVAKQEAKERTKFHPNCHVVTATTVDFLKGLEEKMDFFYIDATHEYEDVLHEISLIEELNLLEDGGVIIGDDWVIDPGHRHHGVCRAVNDFIKEKSYQLVFCDERSGQWVLRKTPKYE